MCAFEELKSICFFGSRSEFEKYFGSLWMKMGKPLLKNDSARAEARSKTTRRCLELSLCFVP